MNIFSPWEQRVIARCQGHSSFVSAVAFDDARCDGRTYRFGSVGEDNKLILVRRQPPFPFPSFLLVPARSRPPKWDFSSGVLHRPKLQPTQRLSTASTLSLALRRREAAATDRSTLHLPAPLADGPLPRYHPAPSRNEVAVVQPVLVRCPLRPSPTLCLLAFCERAV